MEKLEKNTIKKDRRIINLKEKFLIKTVEEDNSLSIDKMFSENSYSNFIKTFERNALTIILTILVLVIPVVFTIFSINTMFDKIRK